MTARASTPESSCSSCRGLVLRACGAADLEGLPVCTSCSRVVCADCELLGYCLTCARRLWMPPLELEDDERPAPGSVVPAQRLAAATADGESG